MRVRCNDCGTNAEFTLESWRCDCGGAWEPVFPSGFDSGRIIPTDYSIWRYGDLLPLDVHQPLRVMGVGWTPLVPVSIGGREVQLKLEFLSPSGSFKDRGVNAMVNQLAAMGASSLAEDSSGNAGASLAAHAARFDLEAEVFVPATTSPAKIRQIAVYGTTVTPVPGPRQAAADAVQASLRPGRAYASHAYNPAYLAGQTTAAYEIWEQLGHSVPDWFILPAAQGGQFLGLYFGFSQLLAAGLIEKLPHLVAVQAERVAPIVRAWEAGLDHIPAVEPTGLTLAEGASIPRPVRDKRILQALQESGGTAVAVSEDEITAAQETLAHQGYYIEPTSALASAGYLRLKDQIGDDERVVLTLTGSGLKGKPKGK
ncbi:threonine synthase (plasmid) [Chloroflexota bacterium]|nr:threonine synthase [Chloroflexota bacterium]